MVEEMKVAAAITLLAGCYYSKEETSRIKMSTVEEEQFLTVATGGLEVPRNTRGN
jgi:hypothetical protein